MGHIIKASEVDSSKKFEWRCRNAPLGMKRSPSRGHSAGERIRPAYCGERDWLMTSAEVEILLKILIKGVPFALV